MRKENYKSDLRVAVQLTLGGEIIPVPDHDFMLRFTSVGNYITRKYDCKREGDVWTNCYERDGQIICCLDRHKFMPGRLSVEYYDYSPADDFPDGNYLKVVPRTLDIELISGAGDDAEEIDATIAIDITSAIADAKLATIAANQATTNANAAALNANNASSLANESAANADTAAASVESIIIDATAAISDARSAIADTNIAKDSANSAATTANNAAINANNSATLADAAAGNANVATNDANQAASDANRSALWANDAADRVEEVLSEFNIDNYYTRAEINQKFAGIISGKSWIIVGELPINGDSKYIYLIPNGSSGNNSYDEYVWLSFVSRYEKIGSTTVNLNDYYTKAETDSKINIKYTKPSSGIPLTDLDASVQTSLSKADTALQSYTETDPTVPSWAKASSKPTYTGDEITYTGENGEYAEQGNNINDILEGMDSAFVDVNTRIDVYCPIIEDTRASAAATITGVAPFATLTDKQMIIIRLARDTGNYTKVNLTLSGGTTTGEIPVYTKTYNSGVGQILSQHFMAGTCMELLYTASTNRWMCLNLDRDTTGWKMSQSEINSATDTDVRAIPTAKLLRDNFYLKSEVNNLNPIIEDTRESAEAAITGVAPFTTLSDGQRVTIKLKYNTPYNSTLTLTGLTNALPIIARSNGGNTAALAPIESNGYHADTYMELIYDATNSRWVCTNYDRIKTYEFISQTRIDNSTEAQGVISGQILRNNFYIKTETNALLANYCPIIEDGRTSKVLGVTGTAPFNELVDGQRILMHWKYAAATGVTTLTLTLANGQQTSAIPMHFAGNNSTSQYLHFSYVAIAGFYVEFIYDATNTRWLTVGYDKDTLYTPITQTSIDTNNTGVGTISGKLLRDNFYTKAETKNLLPVIEDTRQSNSQALTGVAPFSSLVDGQVIILNKIKYLLQTNPTLQLTLSDGTTTAAIPMWCDYQGGSGLKQQWGGLVHVGGVIALLYEESNSRWVLISQLDTNSTYGYLSQSDIDSGTSTVGKIVTPKLLRENFYLKSEVDNAKQNKRTFEDNPYVFVDVVIDYNTGGITQSSLSNALDQYYDGWDDDPINAAAFTSICADLTAHTISDVKMKKQMAATLNTVFGEFDVEEIGNGWCENYKYLLDADKYIDIGTVNAVTLLLPTNVSRTEEYLLTFVVDSAWSSVTLPSGVVMADGFEWSEAATGVVFEVSIKDGRCAYLCVTPSNG